jgi:hypothetical protein
MVNFEFTEEQKLFRQTIHELCQKHLPLDVIREMDKTGMHALFLACLVLTD